MIYLGLSLVLFCTSFSALIFLYAFKKNKRVEKPCIIDYIGKSQLGPYYISLKKKLNPSWQSQFRRNDHGAFLSFDHSSKTWYVNAVANCHQALAHYERYLCYKDTNDLSHFLSITEAIIKSAKLRKDGSLVLEYPIQYFYLQKTPWISAMGQGQLLLVLSRAYQETEDDRFIDLGFKALKPFTKDIQDGGVRSHDPQRGTFYEEYAFFENNKQHHTLNGMMSALMGVHDFWKITGDDNVKKLFDEGIATIVKNLDAYEFNFGSSYDLRHEHGEPFNFMAVYHSVHVSHLKILYALTNISFFIEKSEAWDKKLNNTYDRLIVSYRWVFMRLFSMKESYRGYGGWIGYSVYVMKRLFPHTIGKRI